jgi:hypothetical protein
MIADLQRRLKKAEEQSPDAQKVPCRIFLSGSTRQIILIFLMNIVFFHSLSLFFLLNGCENAQSTTDNDVNPGGTRINDQKPHARKRTYRQRLVRSLESTAE